MGGASLFQRRRWRTQVGELGRYSATVKHINGGRFQLSSIGSDGGWHGWLIDAAGGSRGAAESNTRATGSGRWVQKTTGHTEQPWEVPVQIRLLHYLYALLSLRGQVTHLNFRAIAALG